MPRQMPLPVFSREVDMYEPLLILFSDVGIAVAETPFFGKRIDLLFGTPSLLRMYAVETKLHAWRSAFKQAALNQLAAQRSFVAVPWKLAELLLSRERNLFLKHDIGLIGVAEHAKIFIASRKSACFNLRHYHILKATVIKTHCRKPKRIGAAADAIATRSKTLVVLQTRAK